MKKAIKILIPVILVIALFFGAEMIFPTISSGLSVTALTGKTVHYTAHRGLSNVAPENTLPAIEEAGKAGYYAAEFDVAPTKDGVWILMHDDTVDRMTNGEGSVSDFTYAEIAELKIDAGNGVGNYPDLRIATLEEALDACEEYSMRAMVEVKGGNPGDMAGLLEIIKSKSLAVAPLIIDFNSERLEALREADKEIELWYLVSKISDESIAFAEENSTAIAFNHKKTANLFRVDDVNDKGIKTAAWTVDRLPAADILCALGVEYITTNRILP
ncbi:MAG: hypothetical protein IJE48_10965 [Clostridia bacterium]|nr:hypothetical protein [Clostridia bacterium]